MLDLPKESSSVYCLKNILLSFLRGLKNNGITITKLKNLMSISIQPEKSLVIGNRREPNKLKSFDQNPWTNEKASYHNTSFAFVKIHMEMALVKIRYKLFWQRVAKFFFIVIMMNGTFFANFLLQFSSLSDLRELRSALIVELSSIVSLASPLFR